MKLTLWQVDAFAKSVFEGNPAAIIALKDFLDANLMQKIANENNLAETAYIVARAPGQYGLRWFTPDSEVDLCGHATLASAWLIFEELEPGLKQVQFETRSGILTVTRGLAGHNVMSLPSDSIDPVTAPEVATAIGNALGTSPPKQVFQGRYMMAVWESAADIRALKGCGNIDAVLRPRGLWGFIATAPGDADYDFVSRFFAPANGIPEDPVTGSAHCALTPYWAKILGKKTLKARQLSPRGGDLICADDGNRIILSGPCALYMRGEINV